MSPAIAGFFPATNGSATSVGYIQNPSVFVNQGSAFGNLGRNATNINERVRLQFRADTFDALNQANFTNPNLTVGSATLGLITGGTRFAAGDFGTSRLQLSMKLLF